MAEREEVEKGHATLRPAVSWTTKKPGDEEIESFRRELNGAARRFAAELVKDQVGMHISITRSVGDERNEALASLRKTGLFVENAKSDQLERILLLSSKD